MRKIIITFLAVLQAFSVMAQTDSMPSDAELGNFLAAYNDEAYSKAIALGNSISERLSKSNNPYADSVYNVVQLYIGKSYFRLEKPLEAARTAYNAVKKLREMGVGESMQCSIMLDNAGMYYTSAEKVDSGLQCSLEALQIINRYPDKAVTTDMQSTLMHIAESYYYAGKYQEAIIYEIRALSVLEKLNGRYSKEYMDEMQYLTEYYRKAGQEKKASDNEAELQKIQDGYDDGQRDLPDADLRDLSSAAECHRYNYEAYRCADYLLSHRLTSAYFSQCFKYLLMWSVASSDITVSIGENEAKNFSSDKSKPYFAAYLAGCTKYALENNEKTFTPEMFNNAMIDMLNFYLGNRDLTGEVKYLEKYINVYNKDKNKFYEMIEKNFPNKK